MLHAVIDAVSNREDWIEQVEVRDQTNVLIDLTGATIVFAVRDKLTKANKLLGSTNEGNISIIALGTFQWSFTAAQMRGMDASRAYECGCTIALNGSTKQFFVGTVNVLDGIVP